MGACLQERRGTGQLILTPCKSRHSLISIDFSGKVNNCWVGINLETPWRGVWMAGIWLGWFGVCKGYFRDIAHAFG